MSETERSLRVSISMFRSTSLLLSAKKDKSSLKKLFSMISADNRHISLALFTLCFSTAGTLSFPFLTGKLMDSFNVQRNGNWVKTVNDNAKLCMAALVLAGAAGSCRVYLLETAAEKISRRLRSTLFNRLLHRPQGFFDTHKTGELMNRLGNDITVVSRSVIDSFWGIRTGLNAVLGTVMVGVTAPASTLPQLIAPVAGIFLGGLVYGRIVKRLTRRKYDALAEAGELAEEKLSLVKIVKLFNGESRDIATYDKVLDKVYHLASLSAAASAGQVMFYTVLGGGFIVNVVYSCGLMITEGSLTLGQTSALAGYLLLAGRGYQGIMSAYADIQKALGASSRVLDLIGEDEKVHAQFRPLIFTSPPSVEFKNVGFEFPTDPNRKVLNGLSMMIPSGCKHAIIGPSGCGKSSVLMLLTKMYEPSSGVIMIDGRPSSDYEPSQLRSAISIVPQESSLFSTSVAENITYPGNELMTDDVKQRITNAAQLGFIRDWSASAGERGQSMSGGERQRICIARALHRDSPLLLLDEATSALDRETDSHILNQLSSWSDRKTVIAVTHKLNTVYWSDRLSVIEGGVVVQEGDTRKLLESPGPTLKRLLNQIEKI